MKSKKRLQSKSVPLRTCLGCLKIGVKHELLRFVLRGPKLIADPRAVKEGRGVYCCQSRKCLQQMLGRRKRLLRAFRASVPEHELETDGAAEIFNSF